MTKKNIFLTGGRGFIGRNIHEQFSEKYDISAPTHSELNLEDASEVEDYLKSHAFDVVVHAAAVGVTRKFSNANDVFGKNLRIFFNITRCNKHFKRLINIGSGAEYGKNKPLCKVKEDYFDNSIPKDDYGFYKYVCSKYIEKMDDAVVLRLFGCYGKYEDYGTRFVSNAICKTLFDLPITITNKNVFFDYLHVNDLAKIIEYFIENKAKHKSYNVTPDKSIDLLTLAKKVREISGKNLEIVVKNDGINPEYSGDNSRLKEEINSLKFTDIDSGIRDLYNWYLENKNMIDYGKIHADKY